MIAVWAGIKLLIYLNMSMLSFSAGEPFAFILGQEQVIRLTAERDAPDIIEGNHCGIRNDKLRAIKMKRLKYELLSDSCDTEGYIPLLYAEFNRSILLVGPSGCGKTHLARQILETDLLRRRIELISPVCNDPSLQGLESRINSQICITKYDEYPGVGAVSGHVILFDDIETIPKSLVKEASTYRDMMLQTGRHNKISVITCTHLLMDYATSKIPLNESEFIVLFPKFDRHPSELFLKNVLGLKKRARDRLINLAVSSGRYMAIKTSEPKVMLHRLGVVMLDHLN